jgi:hypothetical protein
MDTALTHPSSTLDELFYAERVARDEDDRVLVWVGEVGTTLEPPGVSSPPPRGCVNPSTTV